MGTPSILVTGGAGFIGSHTVVALAEAGYRPVVYDNFSNSQQSVLEGLRQILGYDVPCYVADCAQRFRAPGETPEKKAAIGLILL